MLDRPPESRRKKPSSRDILDLGRGDDPAEEQGDGKAPVAQPEKPDAQRENKNGTSGDGDSHSDREPSNEDADKGHGSVAGARAFVARHPLAVAIGAILLLIALVAGVLYYLHARHYESTDDAFIDSRPVSISPEISGNIVEIPVTDNQVVHAGDVLARIDDRDYVAAAEQAQAQIDQADASIANYNAQIGAQQSQIEQTKRQVSEAQAALNFSLDENKRYQDLAKTGYGTVQRAQQAASDLQQRQAQLDAAVATQAAAEKQIAVLRAQVRSADGQRRQAAAQKAQSDANLTRTVLRATVDGRVTRLTGAVGQVASAQSALMVLVPLKVWVTANFKETQLELMRAGQPVSIAIDAYGKSYPGRIDSVQAGSGTAFSLLPAQNATGNYVKVVQRIPVKITFDREPDVELGPGMSVVPTVTVR